MSHMFGVLIYKGTSPANNFALINNTLWIYMECGPQLHSNIKSSGIIFYDMYKNRYEN